MQKGISLPPRCILSLPPLPAAIREDHGLALPPQSQDLYEQSRRGDIILDESSLKRWRQEPPFPLLDLDDADEADPWSAEAANLTERIVVLLHAVRLQARDDDDALRQVDFRLRGWEASTNHNPRLLGTDSPFITVTVTTIMIPASIDELGAPPGDFTPCIIPQHFGENFKTHADFSSKRNKHYWLLFVSPKQGAYSLKATCLAAKGRRYEEAAVMGDAATWKEAQDIWAKHCFHRHAKCRFHPQSCNMSSCPAHGARVLADSPVKTELKREREGSSAPLLVKREVKAEEGEAKPEQQSTSHLPFNRRRGSS
ncbi:hypothetical protein B0H14DRAFT_3505322 [Mycena olivaceomarginata]|nr:hypothetical protein B0H14DRAFT_3505322 [Mycena olivaceomarginata]